MKKNDEEEVKGPQAQIDHGVGCPQFQNLNKIMVNIQPQYDELAEELKGAGQIPSWPQQIEESSIVITLQTDEIGAAESLEINLDSMRNMKSNLENNLRELETCYVMQM